MWGTIIVWMLEYVAFAAAILHAIQLYQAWDVIDLLKKDAITPVHACDELNTTVPLGLLWSAIACVLLLITRDWHFCIVSAIYLGLLVLRCVKPRSIKLYDPTDILQYKVLEAHKRSIQIHLAFHAVFAVVLMIYIVVNMVTTLSAFVGVLFEHFASFMQLFGKFSRGGDEL